MSRRRARIVSLPVLIGAALGVVLSGIGMVWVRSDIQGQRYRLAELQDRIQTAHDAIESLGVAREALASPSRVERLALGIGMLYPPPDAVVFVDRVVPRGARPGPRVGVASRGDDSGTTAEPVVATVDLGPPDVPPARRGGRAAVVQR